MDVDTEARLRELLALERRSRVVFLTGAGISAESGIPTFRGEEGYWRVGSRNYHPQELATYAAWRQLPDELWAWYLYRRDVCRRAEPNVAHRSLVALEQALQDRFLLVTQNVDGLHLRAGNTLERTFQIHGNVDYMRCSDECTSTLWPVPDALGAWSRERKVGDDERAVLKCPQCGARSRPHVLWFDESYDEHRYRWQSSLQAARDASVFVIVGTSGATTLPARMADLAARRASFIVVNKDPSPFTELATDSPGGLVLTGTAGEWVPRIVALLVEGT